MLRTCMLIMILLLLSAGHLKSQNSSSAFSNSVAYAEIGAYGLYGILLAVSLNYEHRLYSNPADNLHIYGRVGPAASGVLFGTGGLGGIVGGSLITGKGNHHFEVDAGVIIGKNEGSGSQETFVHPSAEIAYRFQKPGGGFLFKAKSGLTGAIGIALGYAF